MDFQKELLAEYDREIKKTRKILEAIPDGADYGWKPHPKSMTLGRLAGHVAETAGDWGLHALTLDKLEFPTGHKFDAYVPESKQALLDKFEGELGKVRAALAGLSPEKWDQHWQFVMGGQVWIDRPRYEIFRDMVMNHLVHHRAQLGCYIRALDGKLPGTYGPSADEM